METATQNKNQRINLRLQHRAKSLIELAARFEGKTVSHFIMSCALERAEKTVREHDVLTLNARDADIFFDALAAPVRFNSKLTQALEDHDAHVVSK